MCGRHLLQGHTRLAILHRGHEAPALALLLQYLAASLEVGVQLRQTAPEVVERTLKEVVGHEEVFLNVLLLHLVASLAGEDDELADDIGATEVDAGVWLAVALLLGTAHGLAEGHIGGNLVKDEVERSREYGFDFQYLIARVAQVVDGTDDGQTSTHIGLVTEPHTTVAGRLAQLHIAVVVARGGNLVGSHHADVVLQEGLVEGGNLAAGGAVHKDAVEDVHLHYLVAHPIGVGRLAGTQHLLVVVQVDTLAVEHEVVHVADAHHVQLQPLGLHEHLLLGAQLLQEHAAHGADAADEEVEHLVFGEEERVVQHIERLAQEAAVDDKRDVGLRGTLSTGNDADATAAQRAEQLAGDAWGVLHVLAHDGDGGQSALGLHGEHGASLYLLGKLLVQHLNGSLGILVTHTDGGAVFR